MGDQLAYTEILRTPLCWVPTTASIYIDVNILNFLIMIARVQDCSEAVFQIA